MQPLKTLEKSGKQKPRRLRERAGFSKKSNDLNQIVNYLPASLVRNSFAMPGLGAMVPDLRPYRISPTQTNMPKPVDHWVGWGLLVWFVERMAC